MIKEAKLEDCQNLVALSIQVWLHTYALDGIRQAISAYVMSTFTESYYRDLLGNPDVRVLNYWHGENLVGFVVVNLTSRFGGDQSSYEVDTLYVQEHFQGQGIGRSLLKEIARLFGQAFWLSTWVNNRRAIDFYLHLGFSDVGSTHFELEDEQHENRVLRHT